MRAKGTIRGLLITLCCALLALGSGATVSAAPDKAEANAIATPAKLECGALVPGPSGPQPGVPDFTKTPGAPTRITSATVVPATATDPEHCRVEGTVSFDPAVQKIQFRLQLPTRNWHGRYLQYGCGGFCGGIPDTPFPSCGSGASDFAVAATDDGHTAGNTDGRWGAGNQQLRDDLSYRSPHLVSIASKAVTSAYYAKKPTRSYFNGCSNGGREALLLAQRYPKDFDGIIAGAPANFFAPLAGEFLAWVSRANTDAAGQPVLTLPKLPVLHSAVIKACDGIDGLVDGQIDDPRDCRYDPAQLECPQGTDRAGCLTTAQVGAARKLYAGPTDERGVRLYPGGEQYGSELGWAAWLVPVPAFPQPLATAFADNYLKYLGFPVGTPHSALADWKFDRASFEKLLTLHPQGAAINTDLSAFRDRGGKLLLWHGWVDPAIPGTGTTDYFRRLTDRMGGPGRTGQWARLFMIPTLYHCSGGYGPSEFDPTSDIVRWVERRHAPDKLVVSQRDTQGAVTRTRPVFPYPNRAVYRGHGSIDEAANFVPRPPKTRPDDVIRWAGDRLYTVPGPS